jgi:hypothetical protein
VLGTSGTAADNMHFVFTTGLGNGVKTCQLVTDHRGSWEEMVLTTFADLFALELSDHAELHLQQLLVFIGAMDRPLYINKL